MLISIDGVYIKVVFLTFCLFYEREESMDETWSSINQSGLDDGSIVGVVVTIIPQIIQLFIAIINFVDLKWKNRLLVIKKEFVTDMFYGWFLLLEIPVVSISMCISWGVTSVVNLIHHMVNSENIYQTEGNSLIVICMAFLCWVNIKVALKSLHVRKRLIGRKWSRFFYIAPIVSIYSYVIISFLDLPLNLIAVLAKIIFFGCEFLGLIYLYRGYIEYKFSTIEIGLEDGKKLICDIDKIERKRNVLCLDLAGEFIRIKEEDIHTVRYWGERKIVIDKVEEKLNTLFI